MMVTHLKYQLKCNIELMFRILLMIDKLFCETTLVVLLIDAFTLK